MAEEEKQVEESAPAEKKAEVDASADIKQLNRLLCIAVLVQAIIAMLLVGIFQYTRRVDTGIQVIGGMVRARMTQADLDRWDGLKAQKKAPKKIEEPKN